MVSTSFCRLHAADVVELPMWGRKTILEFVSISQSINQSINQPINQSTNQPINQPTNQPINQSINSLGTYHLALGFACSSCGFCSLVMNAHGTLRNNSARHLHRVSRVRR